MTNDAAFDHVETTERFFTVIKSLNEFDKTEIRAILKVLVGIKSDEENAHLGLYYRAAANIETLLALKNVKDVQAIAMIARSLFEIAADSRLLRTEPDGPRKLALYSDLEKLRSARKIVKFKEEHPSAHVHVEIYQQFLDSHTARIEEQCKALWSGLKLKDIRHWSARRLDEIVAAIGHPFDQISNRARVTIAGLDGQSCRPSGMQQKGDEEKIDSGRACSVRSSRWTLFCVPAGHR